jgi:SWI/SNF-related matrix-associated actin-dependent regulator 1 of chromatin subfamily A
MTSWQLDPYQSVGVDFLAARQRAVLADEMGLGKTIQAIAAADRVGAKRLIIVCPAVVRRQWARELQKFQTIPRTIKIIPDSKSLGDLDADVIIVSYDLAARKALLKKLLPFKPDVLILDEAHFLRNKESKRTISILGYACTGKNALAGTAGRVWFLSGTLSPNSALDLYPFMRFCGAFTADYVHFQKKFTVGYNGEHGYVVTRNKDVTDLRRRLQRIQLRRTRLQVLKDLPPLRVSDVVIEAAESPMADEFVLHDLPEIDAALTNEVEYYFQTGKFLHPENASSLRRRVGMMKVLPICQLIEQELQQNPSMKTIVFGLHSIALKFVRAYLAPKYGAKLIFGGTNERRRQMYIDEFQTAPSCRVLVGQLLALGTGVNLTAAQSVWIFEPSWLPDDNDQAIARAWRRGQQNPVMVRFASLAGTIDETVTRRLAERAAQISELRA